jgi:outer membrane protein, multidrug efflux system
LQRQISEEMVASARELLSLAEQRQNIGVGSEQEVAVARANLSTFVDTATQNQLAHQQALRALEVLLGRYPSAELRARAELTKMPGPVPAGMPLEMLERRPDLIAAERRVAAAFNRVGEAKAAMLPRITLNASGGLISSDVLQLKPDFENPTFGAGARLVAPIYQGGALKAQVLIRTSEQKQAVAEYGRMALRALSDVESTLATSQTLADRLPVLERGLTDNQRALTLIQEAYRVGRVDLRSVQQQQLDVHTARLVLLRVQSEQLTQRVNLHLALGGGWSLPPPTHASAKANER